ncbi:MAG: Gfo/Idh/MocA family oxidoreductase [Proteobacteria bacterium]|nr:Gfo/Idh/MocA family oxidoreductase [Pseudomonadota bacterium]
MLNAAIVGVGRWGRNLVDSVQTGGNPKGAEIRFTRAVARTPARAESYAADQKLTLSANFDDALSDPSLDAIVLATPHDQHAEQIEAVSSVGKHVFVEKPLTLSKASAERAVDAAQRAGVVLALGHNRRFLQAMAELKRLVDTGDLGTVVHVEGNFSGNFGFDYKPGMWRAEERGASGAMTAMGIHIVDGFIHVAGPIGTVRCTAVRRAIAVDMADAVSLHVEFASGASGFLSTLLASPRFRRFQVFGTAGWAQMRGHHTLDVCDANGSIETRTFDDEDGLREELEAFAIAASGGAAYPLPLAQAIHGVAVLEAALRSSDAGGAPTVVE